MALRQTKKISELPPLSPASLDTTFVVGISGSTTYKISINQLTSSLDTTFATDLVTATLSGSLDGKLSTSSFNSYTASISTASLVTSISNLNQFTASVSTASLVTSISNLNTFTSSQSTSSLVDRLNTIESVSGSWITESETGSFLTSLSGAISSSSQLTNSFDDRYVLSGSITQTTWDNIASKPVGIVSGSVQVLGGSGVVSGSYETTGRGIISSSANLVTTSSYNADSASFDSRINSIVTESGSNLTYFIEAYASETYTLPGGFTNDPCRYSVVSATENVPSNWFNTSTYRFTPQKAGYWEIIASYDVYRNTEASMAIRKNGGIVASAGSFNAVAQDISKIIYLNGSTDYIDIVNTGGAALQRDQYQQRSWFQAKFVGVVSGSTDLLSANNTFTGTNVFSGSTTLRGAVAIGTSSGDEGGEINLAIASTNQTLTGSVNIDVYRNTLRLWEGGGTNRGVYIDLSKVPTGNTGELTWKASGLVNRGVDVTLGNLKARIAADGNVSLQLSTVSGTYSVYGSSVYSQGGAAGTTIDGSAPKVISTTPAYLNSGYNFGTAGGTDTWNIMDTSNSIAWRITMILGAGVNNNLVSIERLH